MNIVEPYARIITIHGSNPHIIIPDHKFYAGMLALQFVEKCGRVSHRSEDAQTVDSYGRFIRSVVLQHGDWSITEHVNVTVEALVDRGITHEWVRHRIGAYTQESTRFVNYEKKMPPSFIEPIIGSESLDSSDWYAAVQTCENAYAELIAKGITPQIARSVFPNALASKLIVTYNLRSWRHFFLMRTSKEAHPQMKQVTIPLLKEFQEKIPILYEDIIPEQRQADNMRMGR